MDMIETDRLVLRNFTRQDAAALFAYLHKPRADCFLDIRLETIAAAEEEADRRSNGDEFLAVCLKDTHELIGDLFYKFEKPDTYGVGWNFNAAYGGAGYALEAAQSLLNHLFSARQARRIYAYVEEDNKASQRLCEKLGMRCEGTFREFVSFRANSAGEPIYVNTMQYALLRHEWQ